MLLGLLEQVVQWVGADLVVQVIGGKDVDAAALRFQLAFDIDLDKEDLGDLIERGRGIEFLAIADDVVTLVEQVGEFVLFEDFQPLDEAFDRAVAGVGLGNILDLFQRFWHPVVGHTPVPGLVMVVRHKNRAPVRRA